MKTERELLIEIAKKWRGHDGVNYETTTSENLAALVSDAIDFDQNRLNLARAVLDVVCGGDDFWPRQANAYNCRTCGSRVDLLQHDKDATKWELQCSGCGTVIKLTCPRPEVFATALKYVDRRNKIVEVA